MSSETPERHENFRALMEDKNFFRKMLRAHVLKDKKFLLYAEAIEKFHINGHLAFFVTWSWYAFFFGPVFFFYRKMYKESVVLFLLSGMASFTGAGVFTLTVCQAVSAKYFYAKKFETDYYNALIYAPENPENYMLGQGGYHNIAVMVLVFIGYATLSAILF